jgi:Uma2 family endonuclease
MRTLLKIGPADRGRPMTLEEFQSAASAKGYHYELIDGKLYVSPLPDLPQGFIEKWVYSALLRYSWSHPDVLKQVFAKARVFVPGRRRVTCPEPDVAAYRNFPLDVPLKRLRWQDVSPVLVIEVLSAGDPNKDLVRNVDLYLRVPSIKEYWVFDTLREGADRPYLIVYRRWRGRWREPLEVTPGETYSTRLLPAFELVVDPRR